jgi:hypothetical protein
MKTVPRAPEAGRGTPDAEVAALTVMTAGERGSPAVT